MFVNKAKWPNGMNNAVMISVNLDAEYYAPIPDPNLSADKVFRIWVEKVLR